MVVSTRRTPRKSERGMGKLVEESEGGSTTLNNAKNTTTTPMKRSSRQQKSTATPLPKTAKRGRPPTPVSIARKDRTTPIRGSTKKIESSIPVTSSTRKRRSARTPASSSKCGANATSRSSLDVQPHVQHTMEKKGATTTITTPNAAAAQLSTPQNKLLPLNSDASDHISRITLGSGKAATPLKEWKVMDAEELKSLLKSRKRGDRETAMAKLSFDGIPLQDMSYSDFEEILEYMNVKVKKGNTAEELRLILAQIMIETIEGSMDPIDDLGEVTVVVEEQKQQEQQQLQQEQQSGGVEENSSNITEMAIANEQALSPGTDVEYKGLCVGDMTNVQLHDYLEELDMKRGGSKAVRATRLREGLLRLKAETLAGIYNGKAFDDMSEFELREALEYEGEQPTTDGTVAELKTCLMGLLLDWANNDVHLIQKGSEKGKKQRPHHHPPPLGEGTKYGAGKEKEEVKVVAAVDTGHMNGSTPSTVRGGAPDLTMASQEEEALPLQKKMTTSAKTPIVENDSSSIIENLGVKESKKKKRLQLRNDAPPPVRVADNNHSEEDNEGGAQKEGEDEERFIHTTNHNVETPSSIISKDVVVVVDDIKEDKELISQQSDVGAANLKFSTKTINDDGVTEKFVLLAGKKLHKTNARMEEDTTTTIGVIANSTAYAEEEEEEKEEEGGGTSKRMAVEKNVDEESNSNVSFEEASVEEISIAIPEKDPGKRHELDSGEEELLGVVSEEKLPVVVVVNEIPDNQEEDKDYYSHEGSEADHEMTSNNNNNEIIEEENDFGIEPPPPPPVSEEEEVAEEFFVETMARGDYKPCIEGGKIIFDGTTAPLKTTTDYGVEMEQATKGIIECETAAAGEKILRQSPVSFERKKIESKQGAGINMIGLMEATTVGTTTIEPQNVIHKNTEEDSTTTSLYVKPNAMPPLNSSTVLGGTTQIINDDDSDHHHQITYNTKKEGGKQHHHHRPEDHHPMKRHDDSLCNDDEIRKRYNKDDDGLPENRKTKDEEGEHHIRGEVASNSTRQTSTDKSSPLERLTPKQRVKFLSAIRGRATITPEEFGLFSRALGRIPTPTVNHNRVEDNGTDNNNGLRSQIVDDEKREKKNLRSSSSPPCSTVGVQRSLLLHNRPGRSSNTSASTTSFPTTAQWVRNGSDEPSSLSTRTLIGKQMNNGIPPFDLQSPPPRHDGPKRDTALSSGISESNRRDKDNECLFSQNKQQQLSIEPVNVSKRKRRVSYGPCTRGGGSGLQLHRDIVEGGSRTSSNVRFFPRVGTSSLSFTRMTNNFGRGMELASFSGGRKSENMHQVDSSTGSSAAAPVSTRILAQQAVALRILEAVQSTTGPQEPEWQSDEQQSGRRLPLEKMTDERVISRRVKESIEHNTTPPKRVRRSTTGETPPPPSSSSLSLPLPAETTSHATAGSLLNNNGNDNPDAEFFFRDPSKVIVSENPNILPVGSSSTTTTAMQHDGGNKSPHLFSFSGPIDSAKRRRSMEMGLPPRPPQAEKKMSCNSSNPTINVLTGCVNGDGNTNVKSSTTLTAEVQSNNGVGVNAAPNPPLSKMNAPLGFDMQKFRPKRGQWKCPSCSVVNEEAYNKCPCCETCKPDEGKNKGSSVGGAVTSNFVERSDGVRKRGSSDGMSLFVGGMPPQSFTAMRTNVPPTLVENEQQFGGSNATNVSNTTTAAGFTSSGFKGFSFGTTPPTTTKTPNISNLTTTTTKTSSSKDFNGSNTFFGAKTPQIDGGSQPSTTSFTASNAAFSSTSKSVKSSTGDKMCSTQLEPFSFGKTTKANDSSLLFTPPVAGGCGTMNSILSFGTGSKPSLPVPSLTDFTQSSTTATVSSSISPPFKQHS